ncbi:MAG: hypothetical protein J0L64_08220 [Acidobacteria bacterium]|nr:hypothetical protein [Acidobacteriota bacterium]
MSCMASAGLLVLRQCGQPAVGGCSQCGKSLCMMHMAGGTCPECMAMGGQVDDSEAGREAASRNDYYNTYGGGEEYGSASYFSQGNRGAMGPGAAGFTSTGDDDYDPFDT